MFIKKDLRRIEEILEDENVNHDSLMFSKRASEFNSSIQILTYDNHVNFMKNAKSLNLYDNKLSSVSGIEKFRILSSLQDLNLGCNQLSSLPSEVRYKLTLLGYFWFVLLVWTTAIVTAFMARRQSVRNISDCYLSANTAEKSEIVRKFY
jgi:Leucine-rich repeat (LRR) protein